MAIVLDGTSGITNDSGYTGDGVSFADSTPANTLVTTSGGNVGIGTSSPVEKLTVFESQTSGTNVDLFSIRTASDGVFTIRCSDLSLSAPAWAIRTGNAEPLTFVQSATERARIDSSGNLLVGTTSAFGKLVAYSSASSGAIFKSVNNSAAGTGWDHFNGTSSNNNVQNIIIYGNGNIQNANNSYGSLSDVKLKENIVDATPKLEKLDQVRIVNFNLKGEYEQHKQIGVIAQELEQIFPGMVDESPDRDAEGNDLGTTTKAVKYSVFVPMLIKGLQELKAINDAQAQTIDAQQAALESLTARVVALEGQA